MRNDEEKQDVPSVQVEVLSIDEKTTTNGYVRATALGKVHGLDIVFSLILPSKPPLKTRITIPSGEWKFTGFCERLDGSHSLLAFALLLSKNKKVNI